MYNKLKETWADLRSSLWFIPMIMFITSILLAFLFIRIDVSVDTEWLIEYSPIFAISTGGTRAMLLARGRLYAYGYDTRLYRNA